MEKKDIKRKTERERSGLGGGGGLTLPQRLTEKEKPQVGTKTKKRIQSGGEKGISGGKKGLGLFKIRGDNGCGEKTEKSPKV